MHKSASNGLRMHLRAPKISKFSWGGGRNAPRPPYKRVGLRPLLLTKGAPVAQFAQGLLNPLGSPVPRSAPGLATKLGHTHSMVTQQPLSKKVLKST